MISIRTTQKKEILIKFKRNTSSNENTNTFRTNIIDVSHMSGIRYFSGAAQDGEDVIVVDQDALSRHNEKKIQIQTNFFTNTIMLLKLSQGSKGPKAQQSIAAFIHTNVKLNINITSATPNNRDVNVAFLWTFGPK